jgi:hypothetical protein
MIEHLILGATQASYRRWLPISVLILGGATFAEHSGRALLMGPQAPSAFAAIAQSTPNGIAGLGITKPSAITRGRHGRPGVAGGNTPEARPASFGVASAEPLNIGGRESSPIYRPNVASLGPISREALNFVPPDDVLPAGGGGSLVNSAAATPPTPAVPEPSSIMLGLFGLVVLGFLARRDAINRSRARQAGA